MVRNFILRFGENKAMTIVTSAIQLLCKLQNIELTPKRKLVVLEMAKCVVAYESAKMRGDSNRMKNAIEDFFNALGLTSWRGRAMAEATMQEALECGDDDLFANIEAAKRLRNLMNDLSAYEPEVEDDEEDEDEGNDIFTIIFMH